ncbi:putative effector [Candidatus Phytoplasma solani]|uniref:Putative effector n=2 Tax=Candidatus Phytoplasma solani TaxID=69896 RepID=A0A421NV20_9MOLU|nr:putative effector [Candidatus Phytoplasma solani]
MILDLNFSKRKYASFLILLLLFLASVRCVMAGSFDYSNIRSSPQRNTPVQTIKITNLTTNQTTTHTIPSKNNPFNQVFEKTTKLIEPPKFIYIDVSLDKDKINTNHFCNLFKIQLYNSNKKQTPFQPSNDKPCYIDFKARLFVVPKETSNEPKNEPIEVTECFDINFKFLDDKEKEKTIEKDSDQQNQQKTIKIDKEKNTEGYLFWQSHKLKYSFSEDSYRYSFSRIEYEGTPLSLEVVVNLKNDISLTKEQSQKYQRITKLNQDELQLTLDFDLTDQNHYLYKPEKYLKSFAKCLSLSQPLELWESQEFLKNKPKPNFYYLEHLKNDQKDFYQFFNLEELNKWFNEQKDKLHLESLEKSLNLSKEELNEKLKNLSKEIVVCGQKKLYQPLDLLTYSYSHQTKTYNIPPLATDSEFEGYIERKKKNFAEEHNANLSPNSDQKKNKNQITLKNKEVPNLQTNDLPIKNVIITNLNPNPQIQQSNSILIPIRTGNKDNVQDKPKENED